MSINCRLICLLLPAFLILSTGGIAQGNHFKADKALVKTIRTNLKQADKQYHVMMNLLPADRLPKTYDSVANKLETSGTDWWCSGFYPGILLNIYAQTHDKSLLTEADKKLGLLTKEQYNKGTHDLGFMMYCSFGTAQKLEPDPANQQILINSAKSLSTRFDAKVGCIRSWNGKKDDYLVIIDNMMNLELLFWATQVTGDSSFYKIAITHANTTMKNHYRPDFSSWHVLNYNAATGEVKQKKTAQGYSDQSAWARGQAWGLYGFTMTYRETKDKKYLDQANAIAGFILNNPALPAHKIPYWDFNDPKIPNTYRDASAAAVMASALLELCQYVGPELSKKYYTTAETILRNLSTPQYLAKTGTNGGFLLKHSVGNLPSKSEIDAPLTYADYYFIEAMLRYITLAG